MKLNEQLSRSIVAAKDKKTLSLIFDMDDYERRHAQAINQAIAKCRELNGHFGLNVFIIPGMLDAQQVKAVHDVPGLVPCLHGFFHKPKECQGWTRDMANKALTWAEKAQFNKVFRAPFWETSDGLYEAIRERQWVIADHPKKVEKARSNGLAEWQIYIPAYGMDTLLQMSDWEIWSLDGLVKLHGHPKHLEAMIKVVGRLMSIDAIVPTFRSIWKNQRELKGKYDGPDPDNQRRV